MSSLVDYKKFMLIQENITNFFPQKEEQNLRKIDNKSSISNNNRKIIIPKFNKSTLVSPVNGNSVSVTNRTDHTDALFWCFYILLKGEHDYELNHSFQTEKEFKIQSIEELRKIKPQLKALKIKINETEDELLNAKKITIKSLIALSLLYKKNLLYVWDRKYYEFITDSTEPINIITYNKERNTYLHSIDDQKYKFYTDNYWCIQNIDKPLKSITSYTREELLEIVKKLDITIVDRQTKKRLYEKILEKM